MIRTPINVYPQNVAIDTSISPAFSFTFSGNRLTGNEIYIYDCYTEKPVGYSENPDGSYKYIYWFGVYDKSKVYNNAFYSAPLQSLDILTTNGRNYKWGVRTFHDVFDVILLTGKIRQDSTKNNIVYVSKELDGDFGIKTPIIYNDTEIGCQYLQIEYERHKIIEIDNKSDDNYTILYLDEPFTKQPKTSDSYKIITNYVHSPFYYFKARSTPIVETAIKINENGMLSCSGTYTQAEDVPIKKYKWQLYKIVGDKEIFITESKYIFNASLEYTFYQFLESECSYKAKLIVINQDDTVSEQMSETITIHYGLNIIKNVQITFDEKNNAFDLYIQSEGTINTYNIFRKKNQENEIRYIGNGYGYECRFKDYLISSENTYTYYILPYSTENGLTEPHSSITNHINIDGWSLTSLSNLNRNNLRYDFYSVMETWNIEFDVQNNSIVNNLNREAHIGSGIYPKISMNDVNYITGGFTGLVSSMNCSNDKNEIIDDIERVEKWRKFITGNNPFLIKSPKGDIWFAHISDNPSTEYDNSTYLTTVTVSFTQTEDIDNILIV